MEASKQGQKISLEALMKPFLKWNKLENSTKKLSMWRIVDISILLPTYPNVYIVIYAKVDNTVKVVQFVEVWWGTRDF